MKHIFSVSARQLSVISMVVLMVVVSSCSKKEYPANLTMIPRESLLVGSIDIEQLIKKADVKELKNSATFTSARQELFANQPALKAILEDPSKSGIAFKEVFLFLTGKHNVGFTFALKSESDFESMLKELAKQENTTLNIRTISGCKFLSMPQNDSASLVWDKEKALIVAKTPQDVALKIFATKPEASIVTDKDFAAFYKKKSEVALWTKNDDLYSSLGSWLQNPMLDKESELVKGTYSHFNLEFKEGEVVATAETTPQDVAKKMNEKYLNAHPDDELLKYFPEQTLMLARVSMNVAPIMDYLSKDKNYAELITPDIRNVVNSLGGDVIYSLSGFADAGFPLPQMSIAATVKDKTLYNLILNQWLQAGKKDESRGYVTVFMMTYTFYIAQKENKLMVTNEEEVIKSFAAGKTQSAGLDKNSVLKGLKKSPGYFYLNLDLDSYPSSLVGLLNAFGGGTGARVKSAMFFKDLQASYDPETAIGKYVLRLKDTKNNSLAVILKQTDAIVAGK